MKKIVTISLALLLVTFAWSGVVWSAVSLPTANFSGAAETTAGVGVGDLRLVDTFISQVNYQDGTSTNVNTVYESILGMTVTISGATRTGDYTFSDAIIKISDGTFNYLSATLSDVTLLTDGTEWYLNPGLDANNQATLNMSNIVVNTDVDHPSKFVNEFLSAMNTSNISGMKMILYVTSGTIEGDSIANITLGLIDGTVTAVEGPGAARSHGYWKNHDEEREAFIVAAASYSSVLTTDSAVRYYLTKKGRKSMDEKTKQQLAALLLNVAASLDSSTVLSNGELEILQSLDLTYETGATVGDALVEIESAINTGASLETAKDLADEINNRDN